MVKRFTTAKLFLKTENKISAAEMKGLALLTFTSGTPSYVDLKKLNSIELFYFVVL